MKLFNYLKVKKNRYTIITVNVVMSIFLAIIAVFLDDKYGASALTGIYILQVICIINWVIAFAMIIWNIWVKSKDKLEKRDKLKGRDK